MADHALEFVTRELAKATACDPDHRIACPKARREGVDGLLFQHIDLRHGNSRGQRHFLHDVEQASFLTVRGSRLD